jgi:hypothetical protein
VVDLLAGFSRADASALVAFLLVALLAALRWIGNGLIKRIEVAEKTLKRLGGFRQNHATRLVVIENRLGIDTIDYDPESDDE